MIDLHMHTKYSDGTDDEIEILKNVAEKDLNVISITDHNTALVYEKLENVDISKYYKGEIIPGIELNTKVLGVPIEILGYGIDYKYINENAPKIYLNAEERNKIEAKRLLEKCINVGIKINENCLENYDAKSFASKFIHQEIRKNEENKKIIDEDTWDDTKVFYRKYMSNPNGPLYVYMDDLVPDFNVAANLVKEAGGLVFIPHIFEYRDNSRKILKYILENYKFDGIECYYTTFTEEQTKEVIEVCKEHNLYMSGGSDYHGGNKPGVYVGIGAGNLKIQDEVISEWKDKVRKFK